MTRCPTPPGDALVAESIRLFAKANALMKDCPMFGAYEGEPVPRWTQAELREDEAEFRRSGFRLIIGGKA